MSSHADTTRSRNPLRRSKSSALMITISRKRMRPKPVRSQPIKQQPVDDDEDLPVNRGPVRRTEKHRVRSAIKKTFVQYCEETTISGIQFLVDSKKSRAQKVFWAIIIMSCLYITQREIREQYSRWMDEPVVITFSEMPMPTTMIPFPAVTICSESKYVISKEFNFTDFFLYITNYTNSPEYVTKPEKMTDDQYEKMRSLLQVCGNYLVSDIKFPEYPPMNVMDHLNEVAIDFDKSYTTCIFRQEVGNCSIFFDKIYTEEGICYSFNALNASEMYREDTFQYNYYLRDKHVRIRNESLEWDVENGYKHPRKHDTYPDRVLGTGGKSGFMINALGHQEDFDYVCSGPVQGFRVVIHSPSDVPQVDKHFIHVPYNRDILVLVKPHYIYGSDEIRSFEPEKRHCFYQKERYLLFFKYYSKSNCEVECLTNVTLKKCGCVHFSMPRHMHTKVCDASKISCYDEAQNDYLLKEYTKSNTHETHCKCLPGCNDLSYKYETSQGVMNIPNLMEVDDEQLRQKPSTGRIVSRVMLHFKENSFTAWKAHEIFSRVDLLSNSGGLIATFLGFSVLSIPELIYFCTLRLNRNIRETRDYSNSF